MSIIKRKKKIVIATHRKKLTRKEKREAEKIRKTPDNSILLLIIYLCGMLGLFMGINDIMKLSFPVFALVTGVFLVLSTGIWYIFFYKRKYFLHITLLLVSLVSILVAVTVTNPFYVHSLETMDVDVPLTTAAMVLLVLVYVMFSLEFVMRKHSLIFLLCSGVVMLGPLVNIRLNMFAITCIVIFQFGFIALNMTDRSYKKIFFVKNRAKTAAVTVITIAAMLLVSFVPAVIIEKANETTLFRQVYQADGYFQELLMDMDIGINNNFMDGLVSRGNNHQTGAKMLDFYVTDPPEAITYLGHFRGDNYDYTGWNNAMSFYQSYVNGDNFCYREPFIEQILQKMMIDGSIENYGVALDLDNPEKFNQYRQVIMNLYTNLKYRVIGYDDEGNYYYCSDDDKIIRRTPLDRNIGYDSYTEVDGPLWDVKTNFNDHLIFLSVVDETDELREYYINENLDCYYLMDNPVTNIPEPVFVSKDELKDQFYLQGGNPDLLDDEFNWNSEDVALGDKQYRYIEEYDLYATMDEYLNITVFVTKDDIYSGRGFLLTDSQVQEALHNMYTTLVNPQGNRVYAGLLGVSYSSDPVGDIYANYGYMGKIQRSSDSSVGIRPIGFQVSYDDYDGGNRVAFPYYSTTNVGMMMFNGLYQGEFYNSDDIDMSPLWDSNDIEYMPLYDHFIDLYEQYIQQYYTKYDDSRLQRLSELCRETPLDTVNEITTFILYTLQNHATYTKTPGSVPFNKETVDYFLFENHKGYCVHFASAATLMYRMYGIPARYVTGYAVNPVSFVPDGKQNGWYKAEVTDYSAHAWVEIFLRDYGWVPVEVTPTLAGAMVASYPGYDRYEMMRIMSEHGWSFRDINDYLSDDIINNGANGNGIGWLNDSGYGWIVLVGSVILLVGGTAGFFLVRRNYLIRHMPQMSCRRLFDRMIRAIHFSGTLRDMNGSERDFTERLCAAIPELDRKQADQVIDILLIENYSQDKATEQQHDLVLSLQRKLSEALYHRLQWYRKPIYKFIKALI